MNIQEATIKAGINGKIERKSTYKLDNSMYLQLTNTRAGVLMFMNGKQLSICWEPNFEDLVADDWIVIEKGEAVANKARGNQMNIQEATIKAGVNGKIERKSNLIKDKSTYMKLTNICGEINLFTHGEQLSVRWDPKFEDLVADDWIVIEKGVSK